MLLKKQGQTLTFYFGLLYIDTPVLVDQKEFAFIDSAQKLDAV